MKYKRDLVYTKFSDSGRPAAEELEQVRQSLRENGLAVVRNFLPKETTTEIAMDAEATCDRGFGIGAGLHLEAVQSSHVREFRHPYFASEQATKYVVSDPLFEILSPFLGTDYLIHNALFQLSLPLEKCAIDFHIDCGSIKGLNGAKKFPDFRIRSILYLSDVTSGGFSYILNSHEEAFRTFFPMPSGELFPPEQVPADVDRIVTVHEPAGTLILFNTHGLHRPEALSEERLVLNTWFAKRDFSGKLPPVIFSLSGVPQEYRDRIFMFDSARGCDVSNYSVAEGSASLMGRVKSFLRAKSSLAKGSYYE